MSKEKITHISPQDLNVVLQAKKNATLIAEKAMLEKKLAEVEAQYAVSLVYLKYGLSQSDTIDNNGVINYAAPSDPEAATVGE